MHTISFLCGKHCDELFDSFDGKLARPDAVELALEVADGAFSPEFVQHIPGAANTIADMLSRRLQPGKQFVLPKALQGIPQTVLHRRAKHMYVAAS